MLKRLFSPIGFLLLVVSFAWSVFFVYALGLEEGREIEQYLYCLLGGAFVTLLTMPVGLPITMGIFGLLKKIVGLRK